MGVGVLPMPTSFIAMHDHQNVLLPLLQSFGAIIADLRNMPLKNYLGGMVRMENEERRGGGEDVGSGDES